MNTDTCTWDDHFGIMVKWNRLGESVDNGIRVVTYQCPKCKKTQTVTLSAQFVEMVPDTIKDDRKKYFKDIVQPYRSGEVSKEFIELYPKQSKQMFTPREISRAKYVWRDLPGHAHFKKSR